jgi:hypothetical protein
LGTTAGGDDPLADQWSDDPQSWSLYAYVRNNPLVYGDPSGQVCEVIKDEDGNERPGVCHEEITVKAEPIDVDAIASDIGGLLFALLSEQVPAHC